MIDPVVMFHPDRPTSTTTVEREAYRGMWYSIGWRSNDDPSFSGTEFDNVLQFVRTPPAWGEQWRKARLLGGSRLVRVLIASASIGAGQLASNQGTKSWYALLRAALQSRYGDGGSGFMSPDWRAAATPSSGVASSGAWTDVQSPGPPATSEGGIGGYAVRPTVSGNAATLTFTFRGTTLDIFTKTDPTYGRVDYQIDGGSVVQIALNSAASIKTTTITGLSTATHTVILTAAAGTSRIFGIRGRNATGVIVDNVSSGGRSIQDMARATTSITDHNAAMDTLAAIGPVDLAIIGLGPNDVIFDESTTIQDSLWNGLEELHNYIVKGGLSLASPPSVITMLEHIGTADTIPAFAFLKRDWIQLSSVVRDFSDATSTALIDYWAMGRHSWDYWAAKSYWGSSNTDQVHPSDAGHQAYAAPLIALLT
jgi:lysophospholipase L1-like esterase